MNTIYNHIKNKVDVWIKLEKENNQSIIKDLFNHIEKVNMLRVPQKEAIETYLWIKFIGGNKKLSDLVKDGTLYDDNIARKYDNYYTFKDNYVTQFLNQFFQDNNLKTIHKKMVNDPYSEKINWNNLLEELLHNFDYPNYLYSLPMGAGKTFLMASFIYIDLYFASLFKRDKRFAHNFVVFAPHASKTAILPSLKTIKNFNPEWILPKKEAEKLKQIITIEILDDLSSNRKDKLHGNNPNLEKVNRIKQSKQFGLVFITNAEKVVLEKYDAMDEIYFDKESAFYDENKVSEIKKTNELREALSQIPNLSVILDEVHHSYSNNGKGQKKLRLAVNILNQHNNIIAVLGMSGTPYVKNKIELKEKGVLGEKKKNISLNQIQDIVYNYPLNIGIGRFLKKPDIRCVNIDETIFLKHALSDFFKDYDTVYEDGTESKIAFYCPSIKKLNNDILPIIKEWYNENRKGKEAEIFRYYTNPKTTRKDSLERKEEIKSFQLQKNSLAVFNNLDKPYSTKRVILLVAIGKEGWDCKSLTSVVLPRQKTTTNFVLQTTCRCLREVVDAKNESALIYLSKDNYETLDKELKSNYQLSVSDLSKRNDNSIDVYVRKPKLGCIKYNQIDIKYKIVKKTSPEIKNALNNFNFQKIKRVYRYDKNIVSGKIGKEGLTNEKNINDIIEVDNANFSFSVFLQLLTDYTYGLITESESKNCFAEELGKVYKQIEKNKSWIALNPNINFKNIVINIAQSFMDKIEYSKEVIKSKTEIELLEWKTGKNVLSVVSPEGSVYKFMPQLPKELLLAKGYMRPELLEENHFGKYNNVDPQDISYNYMPYKMDSGFEQNALLEMLKMAELKDLEVYFNGYKNEQLQSFWIQTPRGKYTPDFLILKRKNGEKYTKNKTVVIDKVIIIETKGKPYYNEEFKVIEKFVKEDFLKHNNHFNYYCFVDEGGNKFEKHIDSLKNILKNF